MSPMQLTRFTDYGLRMLIHLAVEPERRAPIQEIADAYGISKAHLTKVAWDLGALGYIEPTRGRRGGLKLARPPAEIRLGTLVRDTEKNVALVECMQPDGNCIIQPACGLQFALQEALEAFFAVLDEYTLADAVGRKRAKLAGLLQIVSS